MQNTKLNKLIKRRSSDEIYASKKEQCNKFLTCSTTRSLCRYIAFSGSLFSVQILTLITITFTIMGHFLHISNIGFENNSKYHREAEWKLWVRRLFKSRKKDYMSWDTKLPLQMVPIRQLYPSFLQALEMQTFRTFALASPVLCILSS